MQRKTKEKGFAIFCFVANVAIVTLLLFAIEYEPNPLAKANAMLAMIPFMFAVPLTMLVMLDTLGF